MKKITKKQLGILNVLKESEKPLSSSKITEWLTSQGMEISERTVRFYLQQLDQAGFTVNVGKRGRLITTLGQNELEASRILERVGFLSAKIDQMTFGMNFDLASRSGTVIANTSIVDPKKFAEYIGMISKVFQNGYAMGELLAILEPGEHSDNMTIPIDKIGVCSVCSITLNGVLLKYGIPTHSRFGGLLELQDKKPTRFLEIIKYEGTSIDPLEVFISSRMTDYVGAVTTGNGKIGAGFRELPADSRSLVLDLAKKLSKIGLGGFAKIGYPSQTLLDIPVAEGRAGAVVMGGLNPIAILAETGEHVYSRALAGFIEFNKMFHYEELKSQLRPYL